MAEKKEDKPTPYLVDCLREGCDGKVDLNADETCCPKCGRDIGAIYRRHEDSKMLERLRARDEEERKKKDPPKKKGYQY